MSRIGKKSIKVPSGVDVKMEDGVLKVNGPKGSLEQALPPVLDVILSEGSVSIKLKEGHNNRSNFKFWGLGRALLANMVKGVTSGFEKDLEFSGVGFKAQVKGDSLEMNLGFSNPVIVKAPGGITFQVEKNTIKIGGIDKEKVGQIAAQIRAARPPEPYKGAGIKYKGEIIRRKAGKKATASA